MLEIAQNILWLLILIGVMIMIHELGHFWAARYFNVKVETFSLGFGPRLFGFRRGETDYRVSLILFGGYVKMAGEQTGEFGADNTPPASLPEQIVAARFGAESVEAVKKEMALSGVDPRALDPRTLLAKPRWQRLIIAFAGPFMNLLLAVGLLTGLYMVKYPKLSDADMEVVIGHVLQGSAAAKAGIQDGDRIVNLNGKANPNWEDVDMKEIESAGRPMYITVERAGRRINTVVTPVLSESMGVGYAGWDVRGEVEVAEVNPDFPAAKAGLQKGDIVVALNGQTIHSTARFHEVTKNSGGKPVVVEYQRNGEKHTVTIQPVYAKLEGLTQWRIGVSSQTKLNIINTKLSFPDALAESINQNAKGALFFVHVLEGMVERRMSTKNLTGPIGLGAIAGQEARLGPMAYLSLMQMLSLQLAILNLMPIPILDGATILMLLIEIVMRRDLSLNVKEAMFKAGFVFIMMLVAFVIYNDLAKMLPQG
jgi:regulator of sigma E protease